MILSCSNWCSELCRAFLNPMGLLWSYLSSEFHNIDTNPKLWIFYFIILLIIEVLNRCNAEFLVCEHGIFIFHGNSYNFSIFSDSDFTDDILIVITFISSCFIIMVDNLLISFLNFALLFLFRFRFLWIWWALFWLFFFLTFLFFYWYFS
jgi:hypothetical protein